MSSITDRLLVMRDDKTGDFFARLTPTIDRSTIIGIKTPTLRAFAAEIRGEDADDFLDELPHKYFEENQLHTFIIADIRDYGRCLFEVDRFLPYVDNWATCDQLLPGVFAKNTDKLIGEAYRWIDSGDTYTVRFGIKILMSYFLDGRFCIEYSEKVAGVHSDEYYVKMMSAWYFATAIAKQPEAILPYFEKGRLDEWVRSMAIRKARESRRVSAEMKDILLGMK